VDDAGEVEDERVALIEPAVEELEAGGKEMVDLEGDGAGEQDEEAVVDHGVHQPGTAVAHQRLHPQAGVEALDPLQPATRATFGLAALPAAGPEAEEMDRQPQPGGHPDVEEGDERRGDVAEHL